MNQLARGRETSRTAVATVTKFLEHSTKVVEMLLEKRLCRTVSVNEMQISVMHEKETIDNVFDLRGLQDDYPAKGQFHFLCFVDLEKTFDTVPRIVMEW